MFVDNLRVVALKPNREQSLLVYGFTKEQKRTLKGFFFVYPEMEKQYLVWLITIRSLVQIQLSELRSELDKKLRYQKVILLVKNKTCKN